MEMTSEIIEEGMREIDNRNIVRCPSCRNILTIEDIGSVSIIDGTNGMMPTFECGKCRCHIILSSELVERIRVNDEETARSSE